MIQLSALEAQVVRLAVGRRDAVIRGAEAQFKQDVAIVLAYHNVTDPLARFVGSEDGSVVIDLPRRDDPSCSSTAADGPSVQA